MIEGIDGDERIDRLLDELAVYGVIEPARSTGDTGTTSRETIAGPTTASAGFERRVDLPLAGEFRFDEAVIKENLEAVLLVLISARGGAHGKRLIGDLADCLDARLSPGTVYPRLHDLEAAGILAVHELVRTKEYTIADEERTRERIERAMCQHLALGAVFRASLDDTRADSTISE